MHLHDNKAKGRLTCLEELPVSSVSAEGTICIKEIWAFASTVNHSTGSPLFWLKDGNVFERAARLREVWLSNDHKGGNSCCRDIFIHTRKEGYERASKKVTHISNTEILSAFLRSSQTVWTETFCKTKSDLLFILKFMSTCIWNYIYFLNIQMSIKYIFIFLCYLPSSYCYLKFYENVS